MKEKILFAVIIVLQATIIFLLVKLRRAKKKSEKAIREELDKIRNEQEHKNEIKEEIVSGTHTDNINSSLDLLHNNSKRKSRKVPRL